MFQLTDRRKSEYHEKGFVALPPLLDAEETRWQRNTFDHLFTPPDDGEKPLYYDLTGKGPDADFNKGSVPQLLHPSHHATELPQSPPWSISLDIAEQLFDMGEHTRADLIVRDHMITKPPHSIGPTPWHQDEAYWDGDKIYQELSVWFALQETTEAMGCMQFIPGSHLGKVHPHHSWQHDPDIIALEINAEHMDDRHAVACPLHAGGATVHHARTLHYTTGNHTDEARRALILTVGTPPSQRDAPRDFHWNRKDRGYKDEIRDHDRDSCD